MKSLPPLGIQTGKCSMSMDSFILGRWNRHGTKTWWTSSTNLGSIWLTRTWWSGTISFPLGSCVSGGNHILFEMRAIQSAMVLPWFCGGHILSRGRIDWHSWAQSFTQILEEPLESCFGCAILSFTQPNILWWTVVFVFKMGLLHLRRRECMPALSYY